MEDKLDLIIVGAGPTGLMLAAEAARHGLRLRIIDKGVSAYKDIARAVGIQSRTLEIFEQIGIIAHFLQEGLKVCAANPTSNFKRLTRIPFSLIPSSYPFVLSLQQDQTEKILTNHLLSFGIKIERGIECKEVMQDDSGVEALLYHQESGKEEKIQASWLVGCDGAHSVVRKQVDLAFEGRSFSDIFSLADVQVEWNHPHNEVFAFLNPKGLMAAIPLPEPNRYRLVFQLLRCRNLLKQNRSLSYGQVEPQIIAPPSLPEVDSLLKEYAGDTVRVTDARWMANFHINSRMTHTYRKGRVFLAGDAAHIHSPIGAQGMNTGLQDAYNLAWKLAFVHKNKAKKELLDTYSLERRYVGKRILKATEIASYMGTLHSPFLVGIRNRVLSTLASIPFFRRRVAKTISQVGIRYPRSFLNCEKSPFSTGIKAGLRAPNTPLLLDGSLTNLYALLRQTTKFHVLFFKGPENADISGVAEKVGSALVTPVLVSYIQEKVGSGALMCLDTEGKAHMMFKAEKASVYVIRPDGYIGYHSNKVDEADIQRYLRTIFS